MKVRTSWLYTVAPADGIGLGLASSPAAAEGACTPGKTKKIAFMLKQQTAFRYLNARYPILHRRPPRRRGYEVIVQSAENDAQNQYRRRRMSSRRASM